VKPLISNQKKSTRELILHTIKSARQANVDELAQAADISPVTVRHHLNALQADGLIEAASVRRKVGRPYYVYSLSEEGAELFPKRYVRLTTRLLDELKARLPEPVVREVFHSVVESVIQDRRGEYEHLEFEDRLDYLVDLLGEEGFLASWEKTAEGYSLTEYSCPYISVGSAHTEICNIDRELIVNVLQLPVLQQSCMLQGADCCQFQILPNEEPELQGS
jgi:predicted ArsR family transcriptional regulator